MKAMILAAGLGTRLKPLTDFRPKALVEVNGVPMLERVIINLKEEGFDDIIVNVHHFADQVKTFLKNQDFGVKITVSDETDNLLDTGGGIVKAYPILFGKDKDPVLIHNVDILSNANFTKVWQSSKENGGTSLLISDRNSTRKFIFNENYLLKGWHDLKNDVFRPEQVRKEKCPLELAFSGIYSLSENAVKEMGMLCGNGKFSVVEYFLHPDRKENVRGVWQEDLKLLDIGKPATLSQAPDILNGLNRKIT